mgnify:FL=1
MENAARMGDTLEYGLGRSIHREISLITFSFERVFTLLKDNLKDELIQRLGFRYSSTRTNIFKVRNYKVAGFYHRKLNQGYKIHKHSC